GEAGKRDDADAEEHHSREVVESRARRPNASGRVRRPRTICASLQRPERRFRCCLLWAAHVEPSPPPRRSFVTVSTSLTLVKPSDKRVENQSGPSCVEMGNDSAKEGLAMRPLYAVVVRARGEGGGC